MIACRLAAATVFAAATFTFFVIAASLIISLHFIVTAHERFNIFRLFGQLLTQANNAVFDDPVIIFTANVNAFFGNINARLWSEVTGQFGMTTWYLELTMDSSTPWSRGPVYFAGN